MYVYSTMIKYTQGRELWKRPVDGFIVDDESRVPCGYCTMVELGVRHLAAYEYFLVWAQS